MTAAEKLKIEEKYSYEEYKTWNDNENWEIIGGKAYNMAPSPTRKHQKIGSKIHLEIGQFLKGKSCEVFYELDVVLSKEDIVKPDIIVVCDKNKLTEQNVQGAPDMIVEILSPSTAKRDRGEKFELYKKHGVREYWIVDPYNLTIEQYDFQNDKKTVYDFDENATENIMEAAIFCGELKLDVNYLLGE